MSAGLRAGGEPRREVDGVAHDGVRPPRRAADVAGEDVPAVHARAQRKADVGRDDVAERAQHSFLVLPGARRRAAREVELDRVHVDVRLEPRERRRSSHAASTAAASTSMRRAARRLRPRRRRPSARASRTPPSPGDARPRRSRLRGGRAAAAGTYWSRSCRRHRAGADRAGAGCEPRHRRAPSRSSPSQPDRRPAAVSALSDDLAGGREVLELEHARRAGPGDEQLVVGAALRKKWHSPGMDADRHPQLDVRRALACPIYSIVHCMSEAAPAARCACRSSRNRSSSASPRNLRTSPPWRSATSIRPSKTGRDALDELLGAGLALDGQALGERGEAGDVDGDERAVDRLARGASGSLLQARTRRGQVRREQGVGPRARPRSTLA